MKNCGAEEGVEPILYVADTGGFRNRAEVVRVIVLAVILLGVTWEAVVKTSRITVAVYIKTEF